ncbi:MAG: aminotransferase class I/II-fold pyridoxal phosphate-dependent enzyme, partial [Muribaculaceae bacterium]
KAHQYDNTLIIAESVYSMDGDTADIRRLVDIKRHTPGAILYIDEAHGVGVAGPYGLGLAQASGVANDVDIVIGTLGKALASIGAYAIVSDQLRDFLINRARSFIFSTSLPPVNVAWSRFVFTKMLSMDSARSHLRTLAEALSKAIGSPVVSHIQPLIVGDPALAVKLSASLLQVGYKVLPIRTPTVPPGTDRLRFSLSAALELKDIEPLNNILDANAV